MEMDILEKCAYIKGLAEGLNLDATKPEGKVINAILDLLGDLTETVADIDDEVATLNDYVEEIDHDLGDAEEYLYGDDECDCCDEDECDDCDCDEVDLSEDGDDIAEDDDAYLIAYSKACERFGQDFIDKIIDEIPTENT